MKKRLFSILAAFLLMISIMPVLGFEANAAENPYPKYQDTDVPNGDGFNEVPCTRYAWQQAYDRLGVVLPDWGDAINWYDAAPTAGYEVGTTAKVNSIAVWSINNHSLGHVAFVTAVNGSEMTVNEGGRADKDADGNNGVVNGQVLPSTVNSSWEGRTLKGFIYLPDNTVPITYTDISKGTYYLKNNANGEYLSVSYGQDVNGQNVNSWEYVVDDLEKIAFTKTTEGYKMRPLCCESRVVNVDGVTVASGMNVNIFDDVNDASQWWGFEKVSGGYVVRNMMNPSCVLTVSGAHEMIVSTYNNSDNQVWSIQNAITFDANGGTGAPAVQFKNYGKALTLSKTTPVREGYKFLGWATSADSSKVSYKPGAKYEKNKNLSLYAVWEKTTKVTKIEVESAPAKSIYTVGEALDTAGLKVKVHYKNGKSEVITSGFEVSGFDTNKVGKQTITVSYSGSQATFKVTVKEKEVIPIKYADIAEGTYYLKNNANGEYLSVSYGKDINEQKVNSWEYVVDDLEKIAFTKTTEGYKMRPLCCESRIVNVDGVTVASGMGINIFNDVNDASQWWGFEKVSGGYVVRNMMNPSCVLTVSGPHEMIVSTYSNSDNQIWSIQNTVTFDANGGSGAPAVQFKNYGEAITLSNAVPVREGYTFLGWATSANDTQVVYHPGAAYNKNENVTLFARWKENISITKIEIHTQPSKTEYAVGDSLDTTGLTIKVHYSNGNTQIIDRGFDVSGFDTAKVGTQTLTVFYANLITSININVKSVEPNNSDSSVLAKLMQKFPDGKYWSHYVSDASQRGDALKERNDESYADSVSDIHCVSHSDASAGLYVGNYDCNYFDGGLQCCGFARKLGYDAFGTKPSTWGTHSDLYSIKPGDIVHFTGAGADPTWGHWVFVTAVSNGVITVGEANLSAADPSLFCKIRWGAQYNLNNASGITVYSAPNALNSAPVAYTDIAEGTYYLKNNATGEYLSVSYSQDNQGQNVNAWEYTGVADEQLAFTKVDNGYKIRPLCCASRLVNAHGITVESGLNVNIWDDVNDASQWWGFEKVSGGYVVRNMMNPSCVLSISGVREIIISTYIQADHQIWSIQNTVTFDANGGTGAPAVQFKNYEEPISLSNTVPVREGYAFLGWAFTSDAKTPFYEAGENYTLTSNNNYDLYAVWELRCEPDAHKWDAATCEKAKTCTICGQVEGEPQGHKWVEASCEKAKNCTACGKTDGEPLGHDWVDATCETAKTCSVCKKTEGEALGHKWAEATCEAAKTCSVCQKTEGEALGHKWVDATCEVAKTCSVCEKTEGEALGHQYENGVCVRCGLGECEKNGHKWVDATCETAKTCSVCKKTEGEALGHKWAEATCEAAKTCSVCKKTGGEALGHKWVEATCEAAKTCSVCKKSDGEPLGHQYENGTCVRCGLGECEKNGHKWVEATCETAKTCSVCKKSDGEPLGHKWVDATCEAAKTCSVCEKTDGEPLGHQYENGACVRCGLRECEKNGHKWVEATCEAPKTCSVCKKTEGEALGHKWVDATCEAAKTCSVCGKTEGEALGHKWAEATCEAAKTCSACDKTEGEALGHKWVEATCEAAKTCSVCKKTEGEPLGHKWVEATCEAPKTCSVCKKTEGEVLGHKWAEATCEAAKTCSVCGKTEGEPLNHKWVDATCEVAKTCSVCDKTDGEPLGHKWVDATCETAKTCSACQKTEGDPLGHQFVDGVCSGCGKKKASVSAYAEVVRQTVDSMSEGGYGALYDVDGDGTEELIMVYSTMVPNPGANGKMPVTAYSIYTIKDNTVIPLAEQVEMYSEAGGAGGSVEIVEIDGVTHIASRIRYWEAGPVSTTEGTWSVYLLKGTTLEKATEISFCEKYDEMKACVLYDKSYAVFDGVKQDYSAMEAWLDELTSVMTVSRWGNEDDDRVIPLQELLDDLLAQEPSEAVAGDVNGDGKADYSDALLILRASIGLEEITEEQKRIADVTGDGKPDYSDALKILRASIGLETLN